MAMRRAYGLQTSGLSAVVFVLVVGLFAMIVGLRGCMALTREEHVMQTHNLAGINVSLIVWYEGMDGGYGVRLSPAGGGPQKTVFTNDGGGALTVCREGDVFTIYVAEGHGERIRPTRLDTINMGGKALEIRVVTADVVGAGCAAFGSGTTERQA